MSNNHDPIPPAARRLDRLYAPPEIGAPGKRRALAERRQLLLAGVFVLAMALVVVAAFALILPGLLGQTYRLEAYFPDAEGLDPGMQLVQEGYVIGLVERVKPVFPGDPDHGLHCPPPAAGAPPRSTTLPCFRATLRIRDQWPIPRDSQVRLTTLGLLKGNALRIAVGPSAELLAPGAVIAALAPEPDLTQQLAVLTETVRLVVEESIAPTLASIRDQVKTIELLVGGGEDPGQGLAGNREQLAGAFENLRLLSDNLVKVVDPQAIGAILGSVETMSADLARITAEMAASTKDVQRTVNNYDGLATDIRGLVNENRPALERSLDDTQFLLQSLAAALTPILTNIEDASRNLAAFSQELRSHPTQLLRPRETEEQAPWFK
ncbi:MAG TPA: MlaD family protein [Chromatiaceae bacterium]|nr:MlaD family protein [Chromatiaceae bacterium]